MDAFQYLFVSMQQGIELFIQPSSLGLEFSQLVILEPKPVVTWHVGALCPNMSS